MTARTDPAGGIRPRAAEAPGAEVVIDSVGKTFRGAGRRTVALARASLQVGAGEMVCLLGPSGCGKSTLLRIIAGALQADEGVVTVGGQPVSGTSPDRGILFQTPLLFPWLTTRHNILFGPRAQRAAGLHERDDPELDAEADTLLGRVGLGGFGQAFPHELSGGMQHRAAFARALASHPSLLLMDEPFGALDAITRERMHEFLLEIWEQERITVIFVTHDLEEAILLGDRVAVMGGAPPGIREVIDIPLGRPRHAVDADTDVFLTTKRRIRAALLGAGGDERMVSGLAWNSVSFSAVVRDFSDSFWHADPGMYFLDEIREFPLFVAAGQGVALALEESMNDLLLGMEALEPFHPTAIGLTGGTVQRTGLSHFPEIDPRALRSRVGAF